jgi:16S rRNA (cytosine1402-N4)-methyltransferase
MIRQQVFHQPVLVNEIVQMMNIREDGLYCDCTVGGAGHLLAMLRSTVTARFIGIDRDPDAVAYAQRATADYRERCCLIENNFFNLDLILDQINIGTIDGVLFDLGVSYHQLTTPERGFSFERLGDLLMNMSPGETGLVEKLRRSDQHEVTRVLRDYGEVRNYKKLGRKIHEARDALKTTLDLRRLVEESVPRRYLKKNLHKVFQALRMWTNDELENLKAGLSIALRRLSRQGRMLVISYHSGEDRIVKRFFHAAKNGGIIRVLNKKVIKPSAAEIDKNPSARSAKLRVAEKCVSC